MFMHFRHSWRTVFVGVNIVEERSYAHNSVMRGLKASMIFANAKSTLN